MNPNPKSPVKTTIFMALLALAVSLLGAGSVAAQVRYLEDGAIQNANGGWDLPAQGTCPADLTKTTRPDCLGLRITVKPDNSAMDIGTCLPDGGTLPLTRAWTSSGVCNDLNPAHQTEATCNAVAGRAWNAGGGVVAGVCAVTLKGDDRNNVACALEGGTWVTNTYSSSGAPPAQCALVCWTGGLVSTTTSCAVNADCGTGNSCLPVPTCTFGTCTGVWIMPDREAYTPDLLNGSLAPYPASAGDQCLRCHNAETEYNGPRVRDTENFLYTGHKNMARKVTVGTPWGGPPFDCSNPTYTDEQTCEANGATWDPTTYPSDDGGNLFNWVNGTITVGANIRDLVWIYGDWLAPLPRAVVKAPASTSSTCSIPLAGACSDPAYVTQYSCESAAATWTSNSTSGGCTANGGLWIKNAGASYTCGRCHNTGWTSDATVNADKEPNISFPGITWARTADATANLVNTAGGVAGDANKSSSWDVWGISCTRCHNSAVDLQKGTCILTAGTSGDCTTAGGTWQPLPAPGVCYKSSQTPTQCTTDGGTYGAPYSAPTGMSSHHNDLTGPNVSTSGDKGYCSDPRYTAIAQCNAAGAAWLTQCSVAGLCSNPVYTTSGSCVAGGGTWTAYTSSGACGTGGGVWQASGSCNLAGVCNDLDPLHNTQALCEGAGAQWAAASDIVRCLDIHEYGKEHGVAAYEAAKYTGSKTTRGQVITRLCMDCHRQESSGVPYADLTANPDPSYDSKPGMYLKVGPAHGTVGPVSHPGGNMFLNSPHARFTGTFKEVATTKDTNGAAGYVGYNSWFMSDGEAANTGNGCTGCHDVHESVVESTSPFPAIREECTECHSGTHAVSLTKIKHAAGPGTPLENMATKPAEACEICHMPEGLHLWRINTSGAYSTFPSAALTSTVNANSEPDGTFTNAVWVDVDYACGQCHGGGLSSATTTGSIAGTPAAGSSTLTVASAVGFYSGARIKIAGAGALEGDGITRGDFEGYVASVAGNTVTLAGSKVVTTTVNGAAVTVNPTRNGGYYRTKAALAVLAYGMHSGANVTPPSANFTYVLAAPAKVVIDVDGSSSTCGNSPCTSYSWSWGDGTTTTGALATANHDYSAVPGYTAGRKTITLTASRPGVGSSISKGVAIGVPPAPTATTVCVMNANTWVETVTVNGDPSVMTGITQVTVNWGDGTALTSLKPPFAPTVAPTHTYLNPPPAALGATGYTIKTTTIDTQGRFGKATCNVPPTAISYFYIAGHAQTGTGPVSGAAVTLRKGTTVAGQAFTNASGAFSFGSLATPVLKPGNYTITVTKAGLTFPVTPVTVGPSVVDQVITGAK